MPISFTGATFNETFNALATSGTGVTWGNDSTLSGWLLFRQPANVPVALTTYNAGTGSSNAGSFYSFGAQNSPDRALGGLGSGGAYWAPTGVAAPANGAPAGWIAFAATNTSGSTITSVTVSFDGEQWRDGGAATPVPQTMTLQYGFGQTFGAVSSWETPGGNFNWSSPVFTNTGGGAGIDGNGAGLVANRGGTLNTLGWASGTTLWFRWVENNDAGNDHGLAIDNFTLALNTIVNVRAADTSAAEPSDPGIFRFARTGDTTAALTVSYTISGSASAGDYVPVPALSGSVTFNAGDATVDVVVTPVNDFAIEGPETVIVTLSSGGAYSLGAASSATVTIADDDTGPIKISAIQGNGALSPLVNSTVTIRAIVTGDFQGSPGLSGFFVQEEDADADADPATSEGLFVFQGASGTAVNIGDLVQVSGTVAEFVSGMSSLTQLTSVTSVVVVSSGNTLPAASPVSFPLANATVLEAVEGMRVSIATTLTVTDTFELGRFGNVLLSSGGASNQPGTDARLDTYTQFNAPSVSSNAAYQAELALRRIMLDDGSTQQNADPIVFGRGGNPLSASNTLRGGDTVSNLVGIVDDRFGAVDTGNYRLQATAPANFVATNARTETAPDVGGTLKVAAFNVLNYFNGNGSGGGFPTSRGADSAAEFGRQQAKIVSALVGMNADVVGLIEIENDGYGPTSAIASLVNALNAATAPGTYAFVNPGAADMGSDEIAVGFIYKPATVTPKGAAATLSSAFVDPDGGGGFNSGVQRPTLAQTFEVNATGAVFTPVINHLKSKGSSAGGAGDNDIGDGQGLSNGTRTRAADTLVDWLKTDPTGSGDADFLLLGDFNAYAKEDPIREILSGADDLPGSADDYRALTSDATYSFSFDGQWGALDHAFGSAGLSTQVTGAAKWHINADEPTVLDYNTEFKSAGQQASLYAPTPFRSSDHDPIVIGLNLGKTLTGTSGRDQLVGSAGSDVIIGGAGRDIIGTGTGTDRIVFNGLIDFFDVVSDFTRGQDKIDIRALLASVNYSGTNPIADGYLTLVAPQVPQFFGAPPLAVGTLVLFDADGSNGTAEVPRLMVQVVGVSLTADDFLVGPG